METQFLKSFLDVLDWCYKDQTTIYLVKKSSGQTTVEILEIDVLLQTIRKQIEAPLFEGVDPDDGRYSITYSEDSLILIYPTNILAVYHQLELQQIVQSSFNIVCPVILHFQDKQCLVFMDQSPVQNSKTTNVAENDKLVIVPVGNIDELGKKVKNAVTLIKSPFKNNIIVTDIIQVNNDEVMVAFSNGKIWQTSFQQSKSTIISIDMYREQLGDQKLYQINCIDEISINNNSYLLIGDAAGRLSIVRDGKLFIYFEQISFNQIISAKWLSNTHHNMHLALITSDGSFQMHKVTSMTDKKCDLKKVSSVSMFEEVTNQFNFASQHIRQNKTIQLLYRQRCAYPTTLGVMWTERLLYKINKRTSEKKVILEKKLSMFKLYDQFQPKLSLVAGLSMDTVQLVPDRNEQQLVSEPYLFYVDFDKGDPVLSAYQTFDGNKKPLINIRKESGFQKEQVFDILKIDIRPRQLEEASSYRFLVQLETSDSLCLCFQYDMQKKCLIGNVQQFFGVDSLFIGRRELSNPVLLTLQEDLKTLVLVSFDAKLDVPKKPVQLLTKVKQIFWTPFSSGMAVLYESDNLLRFSKNRLETNVQTDFAILAQTKYTLKLHYDEKVFAVQWSSDMKGVVATNHRVCIVDGCMGVISQLTMEHQQIVSSVIWFGSTVLFATERHLMYLTQAKSIENNHGILFSFSSHQNEQPIIAMALSDRVVLAHYNKQGDITFLNKQVIMLECLLLGYLASTQKIDVTFVQNCLIYLDTPFVSQTLLTSLTNSGLFNSANFILANCPQQFEVTQRLKVARALGRTDQIFELLLMSNNEDVLIHRLKNEAEYQLERFLMQEQVTLFKNQGLFNEALKCCEMLNDTSEALGLLDKMGQIEALRSAFENNEITLKQSDMQVLEVQGKQLKVSKLERFSIPEERNQSWNLKTFQYEKNKASIQTSDLIDKELENINRLNLGYDEAPFTYVTKLVNPRLQTKVMHSVVNDNLANWLGHDSLVSDGNNEVVVQPSAIRQMEEVKEVAESNDDGNQLSESDDFDERQHAFFYWRFDEGKGQIVNDMTDNEIQGVIPKSFEWSDEQLQDGVPIEYEDKWGKLNQPSYSLLVDGFNEAKGLEATFSQGALDRSRLSNNFTLEFWLNVKAPLQQASVLTIMEDANLKVTLQKGFISIGTQQLPLLLTENTWNHIALSNSATNTKCNVYLNAAPVAQFKNQRPQFSQSQVVVFFKAHLMSVQVTEVRMWSVNLSEKLIKENYKQPLAMLYDQKRAIKIKIRKREASKVSGGVGLKMASMFDKKIKPPVVVPEKVEISEQFQWEQSPTVITTTVVEPTVDAFDYFGGEQSVPQINSGAFDFGFPSSSSEPSLDFGFSLSNNNNEQEQSKISQDKTLKASSIQKVVLEEPSPPQKKLSLGNRTILVNPARVTTISRSNFMILQTPPQKFQKSLQDDTVSIENEDDTRTVDTIFQEILDNLLKSNLSEADHLIDEGFQLCKAQHSMLSNRDHLKRDVRAFATFKLALNLSQAIATLKGQLPPLSTQEQQNHQSKIASLSNLLIVLQLPPSKEKSLPLKRAYLQFAINYNMKLKKFQATSKIVASYRAIVPENIEDKDELAKINQIDAMCKKYQNHDSQRPGYEGADCPKCNEPLAFGLATPQCQKCKTKIAVCYVTLRAIASDNSPKCNLCLAKFYDVSSLKTSPNKKVVVCPICSLSKIE